MYGKRNECAYMLFYRRVKCPSPRLAVPERLVERVEARNVLLRAEREEYIRNKNTVTVEVLDESQVDLVDEGYGYCVLQKKEEGRSFKIDKRESVDLLRKEVGVGKVSIVAGKKIGDVLDLDSNLNLKIHEIGVHEGSRFLIWNFETINGQVFERLNPLQTQSLKERPNNAGAVVVDLKYFTFDSVSKKETNEFQLLLPEKSQIVVSSNSSFKELVDEVSQITKLSLEEMLFFLNVRGYLKRIDVASAENLAKSLDDLDIESESELVVEPLLISEGELDNTLSQQWVKQNDGMKKIKVFVDKRILEGKDSKESENFEYDKVVFVQIPKTRPVYELKDKIFSLHFKSQLNDITSIPTRLRQVLDSNPQFPASMLFDEKQPIEAYEFQEVSDMDSDDGIQIVLRLERGGTLQEGELELMVNFSDEFQNWPMAVPSKLTLFNMKDFILKKCDAALQPKDFIVYRGKTSSKEAAKICMNEHLSLNNLKFTSGTFIWMEQGVLPKKDIVLVEVFQYVPPLTNTVLKLKSVEEKLDLKPPHLESLGTIDFQKTSTLLELKGTIVSLFPQLGQNPLQIRLRHLHKKSVLGRILCGDERPVGNKAVGLTKDGQIVAEVLEEEEVVSMYGTLLRAMIGRRNRDGIFTMWPEVPVDVVFDSKSKYPKSQNLIDSIKSSIGLEAKEFCECYKWQWSLKQWLLIKDYDPSLFEEKKQAAEKKPNENNKPPKKKDGKEKPKDKKPKDEGKPKDDPVSDASEGEQKKGGKKKGKKGGGDEKAGDENGATQDLGLKAKPVELKEGDVILIALEPASDKEVEAFQAPAFLSMAAREKNEDWALFGFAAPRGPEEAIEIVVDI
eukprot:TRINITY_DN3128_c0_g1_i1.p1 TRINITY_DN3128_c0_g1~~TRINITY_DN3128_c0_g1_i1.p1  ORF type:complete len:891 (-),score=270.67 TRINITY_DN3128_c0_g1_i1:57-2594(-)